MGLQSICMVCLYAVRYAHSRTLWLYITLIRFPYHYRLDNERFVVAFIPFPTVSSGFCHDTDTSTTGRANLYLPRSLCLYYVGVFDFLAFSKHREVSTATMATADQSVKFGVRAASTGP